MTGRWHLWAADTAERVLSTAAQAFLGALVITGWSVDSLIVAGTAAGVSLLKCLAALKVGAPDSASLLPADADPPQDEGGVEPGSLALGILIGLVLLYLIFLR